MPGEPGARAGSTRKNDAVSNAHVPDWNSILREAARFPEPAFQFIRDGLQHTVKLAQSDDEAGRGQSRHVSGQQLCLGLRDLAQQRWGRLAGTVLRRWGVRSTEDFGIMVYALIERGEMRNSPEDSFEDFRGVFDFDEAFAPPAAIV